MSLSLFPLSSRLATGMLFFIPLYQFLQTVLAIIEYTSYLPFKHINQGHLRVSTTTHQEANHPIGIRNNKMSDIEDENISFDYDDDDEEVEMDSDSEFSFESDDGDNRENLFEFSDKISAGTTTARDEPAMVGCNGTHYLPWTYELFIQYQFLEPLKKLQKFQLKDCTDSDLLIMLQKQKWQLDNVVDAFFEDHNKFLEKCGLPVGKPSNNKFEEVKDFDCMICCESYPKTTVYSLTCNHQFCFNCYYQYIIGYLSDASKGDLITCMVPDCQYVIPHKDIQHFYDVKDVEENFIYIEKPLSVNPLLRNSARALIDSRHKKYVACPAPDCNSFAELLYQESSWQENFQKLEDKQSPDISRVPIVGCVEQHQFCFYCTKENHLPCPCWIVKKWDKKCSDDSETANWIDANTHGCPKCQSSIEKNGGCNHMTCRKCKHEFCWVCLNEWSEHNNNYSCNRFRDDKAEDELRKNRSRQSLERYLHFYKRFAIHENSMKADLKTVKKIEDITRLYMEDRRAMGQENLSWNDIQFLLDAMRALQNGRKALKWTYCFAYYLAKSNFSQIFESNQDFLNRTVEDLSEIFESIMDKKNLNKVDTIIKNKTKIINLSESVKSIQKTLIKSAQENLLNGWLNFET